MSSAPQQPADPTHTRKTVSVTNKQAIGLVVAMMSISQLNDLKEFFTGEQNVNIARLEKSQTENFAEVKQLLREYRAEVSREISAVEVRCEKRADQNATRILTLENYILKTKSHGS